MMRRKEEKKVARTELKVLRVKNSLTQSEMAKKLGVGLTTYHFVESGKRNGSMAFWVNLQKVFKLDDEIMWKLQKNV